EGGVRGPAVGRPAGLRRRARRDPPIADGTCAVGDRRGRAGRDLVPDGLPAALRPLPPAFHAGGSGLAAGPLTTSPVGENREPWHGQSKVRSAGFHATVHPRCVHRADRRCCVPVSSTARASFAPRRSITPPSPGPSPDAICITVRQTRTSRWVPSTTFSGTEPRRNPFAPCSPRLPTTTSSASTSFAVP